MIHVTEFKRLSATDINPLDFVPVTAGDLCTNDMAVPRLSSPFTVPPFGVQSVQSSFIGGMRCDGLLDVFALVCGNLACNRVCMQQMAVLLLWLC